MHSVQAPQLQTEGSTGILGTHLYSTALLISQSVNTGRPKGLDQNRSSSLCFCPSKRGSYGAPHSRACPGPHRPARAVLGGFSKAQEEAALVLWAQQPRAGEKQGVKVRGCCCPAPSQHGMASTPLLVPTPWAPAHFPCARQEGGRFSQTTTLEFLKGCVEGKQVKLKILFN